MYFVLGFKSNVSIPRVPICVPLAELTKANSWMARLDLIAETFAPLCVALLIEYMICKDPYISNMSTFGIVAFWNWSTAPLEYYLLSNVWSRQPALHAYDKVITSDKVITENPLSTLIHSWELYSYALIAYLYGLTHCRKQSIAVVILANACLYMTVTSPHNPLLTQFLLDWKLPIIAVSIFRAVGAVFGVAATFSFPMISLKFLRVPHSRHLLDFQVSRCTAQFSHYCFRLARCSSRNCSGRRTYYFFDWRAPQ